MRTNLNRLFFTITLAVLLVVCMTPQAEAVTILLNGAPVAPDQQNAFPIGTLLASMTSNFVNGGEVGSLTSSAYQINPETMEFVYLVSISTGDAAFLTLDGFNNIPSVTAVYTNSLGGTIPPYDVNLTSTYLSVSFNALGPSGNVNAGQQSEALVVTVANPAGVGYHVDQAAVIDGLSNNLQDYGVTIGPEPGTIGLLFAGLLIGAVWRRKKKQMEVSL